MPINNEDSYNKIASSFNASRKGSSVSLSVLTFTTDLKKGAQVLDVGCGSGVPITKYLVEHGMQVTGIDISSQLLDLAASNVPQGKFVKVSISAYQTDEKFDGIVAWDSLFHLQPYEHERVFAKLYKLLNEKGYLLFTHGGAKGQIMGEMYGETFYYSSPGPENIKSLLQGLGFTPLAWEVDSSEANGYMIVLMGKG